MQRERQRFLKTVELRQLKIAYEGLWIKMCKKKQLNVWTLLETWQQNKLGEIHKFTQSNGSFHSVARRHFWDLSVGEWDESLHEENLKTFEPESRQKL